MEENNEVLNLVRESKYQMMDMKDAFKAIEVQCSRFSKKIIQIDVLTAENYVTAEDVISPLSIPISSTSMMDGYAIKIEGSYLDKEFEIICKSYAGNVLVRNIPEELSNKAAYVTTGSCIPDWADCVVQIENTTLSQNKNKIVIKSTSAVTKGKFIRKPGCDMLKGDVVVKSGQRIETSDISLIVACGIRFINVYSKPRIGILSTGDEVIKISQFSNNEEVSNFINKHPHKIIDSNKEMIKLLLKKWNIIEIIDLDHIPDDYNLVKEKMTNASNLCDIVISSGGVSMGEKDLIKVFLEKEGEIFFGRLNMKPGKPTTFAKYGETLFFALPGNPVSCYVTYQLLITYALNLIESQNKFPFPCVKVSLMHNVDMDFERPEYQRAMY